MILDRLTVAKLEIPAGKREVTFWDSELRGFGLRVREGGSKKWVLQYRNAEGIQRKLTLSEIPITSVDQARAAAERALRRVGDEGDPQAEKVARRNARRAEKQTVGKLVEDYLAAAKTTLRPRSYVDVERHLNRFWKPLHGLSVARLDHRSIAEELDKIAAERGLVTGNRARTSLSAMMAWAIEKRKAEDNPVIKVAKPLRKEPKRDRTLGDRELVQVWNLAGDNDFARCVRLLILLAARREEVSGMRWSEFDLERAEWTIPAERSKNKRSHTVPLPAAALSILESVPRRDGRDLLFGEGDGPFSGWSKAKLQLDERIAAAREKAKDVPMQPWRVHDLRRSAATGMARLGVTIAVIERCLNHISGQFGGIVSVYQQHDYRTEMRDAFDVWSAHIEALTKPSNHDAG